MNLNKSVRRLGSRAYRGVNKLAVRAMPLSFLGAREFKGEILEIGTGDGMWNLPKGALDRNSICYSIGVGRDATFDIGLVKEIGCPVYSFDPTPGAVEYVKTLEPCPFTYLQWAVWTEDGHLDFYSQDVGNNVNLSAIDSGRGKLICRAECYRLETVMKRLNHDHLDLLKIDIEGSWLPVIEDFVKSGIKPRIFCVEFDSPTSLSKVSKAIRLLKSVGLNLVYRNRDNYLFVNDDILNGNLSTGNA